MKDTEPMQIRIIQVEIEEAIRNHILNQISLKPDQNIEIELSATRGPEGFIATIDISAANATRPAAVRQPAATEPMEATEVVRVAKASVGIRKAAPPLEAKMDEGNDAAAAVETKATTAAVSRPAAETAAEPAQSEEPAPAPATGRSLFGGLTPPKNS